jgi:hypothetical protein
VENYAKLWKPPKNVTVKSKATQFNAIGSLHRSQHCPNPPQKAPTVENSSKLRLKNGRLNCSTWNNLLEAATGWVNCGSLRCFARASPRRYLAGRRTENNALMFHVEHRLTLEISCRALKRQIAAVFHVEQSASQNNRNRIHLPTDAPFSAGRSLSRLLPSPGPRQALRAKMKALPQNGVPWTFRMRSSG